MTNSDTELSDFTKLVLARLETNPDEFQLGGRWDTLVRGIEAHAIDESESRYLRTLWPLTDHERATILEAYRKAYLARLHKDMLKNIVSGDDLKVNDIRYSSDTNTLKPRGAVPLTTTAMQQATFSTLQEAYNDAFSNAIVKGEGQAIVPMADTNTVTYKPNNRYVLNKTQMEIARSLNMSPEKYAKALNTPINGGTE